MYIHTVLNGFGYLLFKTEETLTKDEISEIDELDTDLYDNPKTKAQRLRNTLYVNWQQKSEGFDVFKDYYADKMEKLIQHYKDKLEP